MPDKTLIKDAKTYTESEFRFVSDRLIELRAAMSDLDAATRRVDRLKTEVLDIVQSAASPDGKAVLPGIQVVTTVTHDIDPQAVLDWAYQDEGTLMAALPLLNVTADVTAWIVSRSLQDESLRRLIGVNPGAVNKAINAGQFADLPHGDPTVKTTLRVVPRDIKVGDDLRAEIDVIPDDVLAEQEAE